MEVVVVDGASPDNTAEVVEAIARRNSCVRYFRETENLGIDGDFDKTIRYARGEYCWLFSDDDLLKPGAIPAILRRLDRPYSALVVNAEVRSVDLRRLFQSSRLAITADRIYQPEEMGALFEDNARHLSFIGALVVRRSLWLGRNTRRYYGSYFVHMGVLFQERLPGPVLAVAQPLIEIRYGNASWTSRAFQIWMFGWPKLIWSFENISREVRQKITPAKPWDNLKTLAVQRTFGAYSLKEYQIFLRDNFDNKFRQYIALIIALTPRFLFITAAYMYAITQPSKKEIMFFELRQSWIQR
jgi:glycosyltransferase involved in cell wall biosynthesis